MLLALRLVEALTANCVVDEPMLSASLLRLMALAWTDPEPDSVINPLPAVVKSIVVAFVPPRVPLKVMLPLLLVARVIEVAEVKLAVVVIELADWSLNALEEIYRRWPLQSQQGSELSFPGC